MLFEEGTDPAHQRAGEIRHAPSVGVLDGAEKANGERAGNLVEQRLEARASHQSMIRKGGNRFPEKIML